MMSYEIYVLFYILVIEMILYKTKGSILKENEVYCPANENFYE